MAHRVTLSDYWLETQRIIAVSQGMFPLESVEGAIASTGGPESDDLSWDDLRDREFEDEAVYDDGQETCKYPGCYKSPEGECETCGLDLCESHLSNHGCWSGDKI